MAAHIVKLKNQIARKKKTTIRKTGKRLSLSREPIQLLDLVSKMTSHTITFANLVEDSDNIFV
jgi:hypothetical protein